MTVVYTEGARRGGFATLQGSRRCQGRAVAMNGESKTRKLVRKTGVLFQVNLEIEEGFLVAQQSCLKAREDIEKGKEVADGNKEQQKESFESGMPLEKAVADGTVKRSKELSNKK